MHSIARFPGSNRHTEGILNGGGVPVANKKGLGCFAGQELNVSSLSSSRILCHVSHFY